MHGNILGSKLDVYDPAVQSKVTALQHNFMAAGAPYNVALQKAYKVLDYSVAKQAAVLSYMDVFLYIGLMFLICIPFVLMVKGNRNKKVDISEAMH